MPALFRFKDKLEAHSLVQTRAQGDALVPYQSVRMGLCQPLIGVQRAGARVNFMKFIKSMHLQSLGGQDQGAFLGDWINFSEFEPFAGRACFNRCQDRTAASMQITTAYFNSIEGRGRAIVQNCLVTPFTIVPNRRKIPVNTLSVQHNIEPGKYPAFFTLP